MAPEPLDVADNRNPRQEIRYKSVPWDEMPLTESMKDTRARTIPYWECEIYPQLTMYDQILVVAHGNSLRGIIKYLKNISDDDIVNLNLPTAIPYVFEFDDKLNLVKDYFIGDPEQINKLMQEVASQAQK